MEGCKGLPADAQTFSKAAANRGTLLSKLAQLPGRSALPAAMISDLTNGWQASATVDADLAKWATSEAGHCKKNDLKNPAYAASLPFDSKATNGKTAFVKQWNGARAQVRPRDLPAVPDLAAPAAGKPAARLDASAARHRSGGVGPGPTGRGRRGCSCRRACPGSPG